jgi:menaquinone-dependent protoporphyrinogen oxidase
MTREVNEMKALIVYGTRGGATKQIADEMSKVLGGQGYAVTVKDAGDTRDIDVSTFDLIIVGSSVWMGSWKKEAVTFVKKNANVLLSKKVALFSSGIAGDDPTKMDEANKCTAKTASQFPAVKPLATAYFGSYIDFNNPNLFVRFMSSGLKKGYENKGIDTSKPVDRRDWDAIRKWTADVAVKAKA